MDETGLMLETRSGEVVRVNAYPRTIVAIRSHDLRWERLGQDVLQDGTAVAVFGRFSGELTFEAHTIVVLDLWPGH